MLKNKGGLPIILLSLIISTSFGQQLSGLKGDYLGQDVPGETPQVFARGIISSDFKEHGAPAFSPDGNEVFWWTIKRDTKNQWLNYFWTMRRVGDTWTEPINMGEQINSEGLEPFPSVSPEGNYFFFTQASPGTDEDVYWVSASIIDELRKKSSGEK